MALTLPLPEISRQYLGPAAIRAVFWIIPGASDYPNADTSVSTGGYTITPAMCGFMRGFTSAEVVGINAAVITGTWLAFPVMAMALTSNGKAQLQTSWRLMVTNSSMVQLANGTSLSGAAWQVACVGE